MRCVALPVIGAVLLAAFAMPCAAEVTVAAVQLGSPATGPSPQAAGQACGAQVARIVSGIVAGDTAVAPVALPTAGGLPATPVELAVFPEYGMLGNYSTNHCGGESLMNQGCVDVPAPGSAIDCASDSPLAGIACGPNASFYAGVKISVNLCERCTGSREAGGPCAVSKSQSPAPAWKTDSTAFFNTQVVLQGATVLQTYRKSHPWATNCYDTPVVDYRSFNVSETPFGLFTCFDIAFKEPTSGLLAAGIRAFSYSSAIPLVGRDAVKLFSAVHNASMVNANLQAGETAVTKEGVVLAHCGAFSGTCAAIAAI